MAGHPFDEAIRLEADTARPGAVWHGATHEAYWNMVGPFGGTTAAVVLQGVWGHPERNGTPISLTLTYAAPFQEGAFEVHTQLVSATRSTQHWSVQCVQQGKAIVNAIALFAVRRETWAAVETCMPVVPPAAQIAVLDATRTRVAWVQRYEFRPLRGGFDRMADLEPQADSITEQWVRDQPARALDYPALASLCDVFFPRLYLRRGKVIPAGTVSLNIYFHADEPALAATGSEPVLGVARAGNFAGGFFDQFAQIWRADGVLLASTQQMVWYKA
ncbi:thioesterase family protein [Verticiella sediminum]|uniref:Thioesterase family protein n=1 Tax=Verticiella sediminum TaxID=1247510 RepID=A0A556ABM1_9BURK|nr:thioesterase family protein [Verticiella sediminum]TSH90292.1 thioesterase family protein [Verticiella sediminum]